MKTFFFKRKQLILWQFGVEVMEQADFPLQSISHTVLCSPSRVFHLQWPCEQTPLLARRFMSGSFLWPALPQPICEKKCPSGGSCSTLGGPVGLVSIRQSLYLRLGNRKREGGRDIESGGRIRRGGGRKKEWTQEDERMGFHSTRKPAPPMTSEPPTRPHLLSGLLILIPSCGETALNHHIHLCIWLWSLLLRAGFVFPLLWNLTQSVPASPLAWCSLPHKHPYHHSAGHHSQAVCPSGGSTLRVGSFVLTPLSFRCDRIGFITR